MALRLVASGQNDGSDAGPGLWARTYRQEDGTESAPVITNVRVAGEGRKRGSALINIATGLLLVLAIALYVVSITAQWAYVMHVKHDDLVSWIEAASLDGGMGVFTLLALGLSRAGQSARIERLFVVICAFGSAAMNYAAADTGNLRSALAYTVPPIFLAAVVDRTVSVIRRHYLGDDDASAWSQLGKFVLYGLRLVAAPRSTVAGLRRELLHRTPVPPAPLKLRSLPWPPPDAKPVKKAVAAKPVPAIPARPVQAIDPLRPTRTHTKATRTKTNGSSKTSQFLELVVAEHGELAGIDLANVYAYSKELAPKIGLHEGSARTALRAAILRARDGAK